MDHPLLLRIDGFIGRSHLLPNSPEGVEDSNLPPQILVAPRKRKEELLLCLSACLRRYSGASLAIFSKDVPLSVLSIWESNPYLLRHIWRCILSSLIPYLECLPRGVIAATTLEQFSLRVILRLEAHSTSICISGLYPVALRSCSRPGRFSCLQIDTLATVVAVERESHPRFTVAAAVFVRDLKGSGIRSLLCCLAEKE